MDTARGGSFGELLKHHRLAAGLTQEVLAERAGLSVRTIAYLERGESQSPHRDTVRLLVDALGLSEREWATLKLAARRPLSPDRLTDGHASHPISLPAPLTSFVGREALLDRVRDILLREDVRLLTLTGTGGVGKTRLAQEVARRTPGNFPGGIYFVPLASVSDPSLVLPAIVRTMGMVQVPRQALVEGLKTLLADRRVLLVLDNFEQVLGAGPSVTELLASCSGLKVLVTSRALLRLYGEHVLPVPPLSIPGAEGLTDTQTLMSSEAVQLYAERARAVDPDFELAEANTTLVAEICRRLDGLPLAIELTAARSNALSPRDILPFLGSRLEVLTGGPRDVPPRQRALRATLDWSYELLEDRQQELLVRLGVFAGGFTLDAARAVWRPDRGIEALRDVSGLVDHSLVHRGAEVAGEPRFGMLETVREYAAERLQEDGKAEEVRDRHARYYLQMAETAEPQLRGPRQREWLERLDAEHDNLRVALGWYLEHDETEAALRLGIALQRFWHLHGHLEEGRQWLERALAGGGTVAPTWRARALVTAGFLAGEQRDYGQATSLLEEGLALARQVSDRSGIALAVDCLGGIALDQDDPSRAQPLIEQSLTMWRELGNTWGVAQAYNHLHNLPVREGDCALARAYLEQSLALFEHMGDPNACAVCRGNISYLELREGNFDKAQEMLLPNLAPTRDMGNRRGLAAGLELMAAIAGAQGRAQRAARLLGATQGIRTAIGCPLCPIELSHLEEYFSMALSELGEENFEAEIKRGMAMSVEQALEYARSGAASQGVDPKSPA